VRAGSSMVEQLTLNQRVAGSSPARLTKIQKHLGHMCISPLLLSIGTFHGTPRHFEAGYRGIWVGANP
jgi:hypothetical protein